MNVIVLVVSKNRLFRKAVSLILACTKKIKCYSLFIIMKLYTIRGGTEENLSAKKYTIGVGISLGNKWFTAENIIALIEWSLQFTKDYVVVYVADSIHAINIEVRNHKTPARAKEIALRLGDEILAQTKILAESKFSPEQRARIHYAKWDGLMTFGFKEKLKYLFDKYETDGVFRKEILDTVEGIVKNEARIFSEEEKAKLGTYIISEFPEILARTSIDGMSFDAYAYPFDGKLVEFIENIQKGNIFPEIREKIMDTEPKVFLEVRK